MLKFSNFSKNLTRSSSILYRNNFSYVTSIFDSYSLRKISKILKVPFYKYNEDAEHVSEVKLLDAKGKFIGVYDIKEAKKKVKKMKLDMVLVNETVSPAVCKVYNYKDSLYTQFIKDFAQQSTQIKKKIQIKTTRTFVLSTKITEHDMKNKIRIAVESTRSYQIIRVVVKVPPEIDEEDAINTLYAFRDLSSDNLVTVGDVQTGNKVRETEDGDFIESAAKEDKNFVALEFRNAREKVNETEETMDEKLTDAEIKQLIDEYFLEPSMDSTQLDKDLDIEPITPENIGKILADDTPLVEKKSKMDAKIALQEAKELEKAMKAYSAEKKKEEVDERKNDLEEMDDLKITEKMFDLEYKQLESLTYDTLDTQNLCKRIKKLAQIHKNK